MKNNAARLALTAAVNRVIANGAPRIVEVPTPAARLEYLRGELRAERISQGELLELESLAPHIQPGDVELLEAAGVPEHA